MKSKSWPLGLYVSVQSSKVTSLQSAYIALLLALLVPRVWTLGKNLGTMKIEIQTLVEGPSFFSIKYSESDKKTFIMYFNGLLSSPLEKSLSDGLLA